MAAAAVLLARQPLLLRQLAALELWQYTPAAAMAAAAMMALAAAAAGAWGDLC
jgi:hypothetical protein